MSVSDEETFRRSFTDVQNVSQLSQLRFALVKYYPYLILEQEKYEPE